ncbi:MAG: ATP-binding protein [Hyphomicrobiales bacterium]|nr:ATP-binding protein [Hyphomicrobiales bacterium]
MSQAVPKSRFDVAPVVTMGVQRGRRFAKALSRIDIRSVLPGIHGVTAEVAFGVTCAVAGIFLRWLIDGIWEGAGPFGLMVPLVLVATLFGRWTAGAICLAITSLHAWYFVLPEVGSFRFAGASDQPRVIVNIAAGLFVVLLAEIFRRAMHSALYERDILLREVEHRVKNNLASVASMMRMQIRQHADAPATLAALQTAVGRVESYAILNSFLYHGDRYTGQIDFAAYLETLCQSLESSLTAAPVNIAIVRQFERLIVPSDRANALGLLVNELVTNAVKHAFGPQANGQVRVRLSRAGPSVVLEVADNGCGLSEASRNSDTLGMKLIAALTQQAEAVMTVETASTGTCYRFEWTCNS